MSATAYAVLWGRLAWHPAVEAWNGFSDGPVEPPEHIEILQQSSTSATYRLVADGGGRSIVARRSLTPGDDGASASVRDQSIRSRRTALLEDLDVLRWLDRAIGEAVPGLHGRMPGEPAPEDGVRCRAHDVRLLRMSDVRRVQRLARARGP